MARHGVMRAERRGAAGDGNTTRAHAAPGPDRRMNAGFHLNAKADEMSVRSLLSDTRARLRAHGLTETACSTVEIVLAEALNNIVEHAYTGSDAGEIGLHAGLGAASLTCTLSDQGAALPAPHLPAGRLPDMGAGADALPEGGFGWFLIRSLTRDVRYAREGDTNRLTLCFDLPDPEDGYR